MLLTQTNYCRIAIYFMKNMCLRTILQESVCVNFIVHFLPMFVRQRNVYATIERSGTGGEFRTLD